MVTIQSSTLRSNVYRNVYNALNNASLNSGNITIYSSYPDKDPSYPMVIIENPQVGRDNFSFDRSNSTKSILVNIDVVTKAASQIDAIVDEVNTVLDSTDFEGMSLYDVSESKAFNASNDNKIHLMTIQCSFRRG